MLQDQYIKDTPFLKPVKGKQNFPCHKLMSLEKVENTRRAMRWGLTCEKGVCQERVSKNGKKISITIPISNITIDYHLVVKLT